MQITARHLAAHGYTIARYTRTFDAATTAGRARRARTSPQPANGAASSAMAVLPDPVPAPGVSLDVAQRLLGNPDFVATLADEVGEVLFNTSLRSQLTLALCSMLTTRLQLHGNAAAHLLTIREELAQPWRLQAGGKDGDPTPTAHLVGMAGEAHHEVVKAEEALLRTLKLAADEARMNKDVIDQYGRHAFAGHDDAIPVPPELPPGERESIRTLLQMLKQEVEARAAKARTVIDVHPVGPRPDPAAMPNDGEVEGEP